MTTVAVTGAAGYIGPITCRKLLEAGHQVIAVDNFYAKRVDKIDNLEITKADITNPAEIYTTLKDADVIIHLAAIPGVAPCNDKPIESFTANVIGTQNICAVAKETKAGVIFAASMALFGEPNIFPITEKAKMNPVNAYGKQKYLATKNILECSKIYNFPALVFLKSNIYGTYEMNGSVIAKPTAVNLFLQKARAGEPLTIFRPGTQVRNFINVCDVANAYVLGVKNIKKGKKAKLVNIANEELSVMGMAEQIKAAFETKGKQATIEIIDNPRKDEVVSEAFSIDTSLAKKLLGFEPKNNLAKFLSEVV